MVELFVVELLCWWGYFIGGIVLLVELFYWLNCFVSGIALLGGLLKEELIYWV